MSSTYGWVQGSRGAAHRCGGAHGIDAILQTWEGKVLVNLRPDGTATIELIGNVKLGSFIQRERGLILDEDKLEQIVVAEKV